MLQQTLGVLQPEALYPPLPPLSLPLPAVPELEPLGEEDDLGRPQLTSCRHRQLVRHRVEHVTAGRVTERGEEDDFPLVEVLFDGTAVDLAHLARLLEVDAPVPRDTNWVSGVESVAAGDRHLTVGQAYPPRQVALNLRPHIATLFLDDPQRVFVGDPGLADELDGHGHLAEARVDLLPAPAHQHQFDAQDPQHTQVLHQRRKHWTVQHVPWYMDNEYVSPVRRYVRRAAPEHAHEPMPIAALTGRLLLGRQRHHIERRHHLNALRRDGEQIVGRLARLGPPPAVRMTLRHVRQPHPRPHTWWPAASAGAEGSCAAEVDEGVLPSGSCVPSQQGLGKRGAGDDAQKDDGQKGGTAD
mmetsp:Transcript_38229/g.109160  ORF Transcript_38229/g.109160 Transcript_38229/m.109160 type:complete len:356 (-) Transcript_38229:332-1399(-)